MEHVKKHWGLTLLLFLIMSFTFTFLFLKENITMKIEKYDYIKRDNVIKQGEVLYNYHRAGEPEAEMTHINGDNEIEINLQEPKKSFIYHKVERGETLWKIANFYNVSIEDLIRYNGIENPDLIYQGSLLKIISSS